MAREALLGHLESLIIVGRDPDPDVNEVLVSVVESQEILIHKVEVDLETGVVQVTQGDS